MPLCIEQLLTRYAFCTKRILFRL